MKLGLWMLPLWIFGSSLSATLSIQNLSYDAKSDELIIQAQFTGKCLEHELSLTKVRKADHRYYFRLSLSNPSDPCNGQNEQTKSFSMANIVERPAEVLISEHGDDRAPHAIQLPAHESAVIKKASIDQNGELKIALSTEGPLRPERFYLEVSDFCTKGYAPNCEAVIKDRMAKRYEGMKKQHGTITLPADDWKRPLTLTLRTHDGNAVRLHLP